MKVVTKYWFTLIVASVVSVIIGYLSALYYSFSWLQLLVYNVPLNNQDKIMMLTMLLALFGGFGALFQYWRNSAIERNHFVKISVSVTEDPPNHLKICTTLDNPVNTKKYIKTAFLIITRKEDDFLQECKMNMNCSKLPDTNSLVALSDREEMHNCHFAFIPLPYYYYENIQVGNEELSYSYILTPELQRKLCQSNYEVRFFVYSKDGHYHRCVQDAFIIKGNINGCECADSSKSNSEKTT